MPEQLQNLLNRIKEWWNHFTTRQKSILVGMAISVVVIFVVIVYLVSRPVYTKLITCETQGKSAEVVAILESANIEYQTSKDALRIDVQTKDLAKAELALASGGFRPDTFTLEDALSSSLSTTASDKEKFYKQYMEKQTQAMLESIEGIKTAKVQFTIPPKDGTLIAQAQDSFAYIQLNTELNFTTAQATNIARAVAEVLGNETTANITVLDQNGELLFTGGDDYTTAGIASTMQELQNQAESMIANQVKKVLFGTNVYNNIEVTSHLDMDYSNYEKTVKKYYPNEGRTEGMYATTETYDSESENGVGGVPGTDSNGEGQTYVTNDYSNSNTSTSETKTTYLPNEDSEFKVTPAGSINYTNSSISVAAISYKYLKEEDAKTLGYLDGMSWDEYKLANGNRTRIDVDEDFYSLVATATGIDVSRITIVAYEEPIFNDKEAVQISWTTVASAFLILLILGLLAFVVLRTMNSKKEIETEPEISVEDLIESNTEPEVEDIDVETKSETRKMIEKFVDENPESAALLLRNWLNEEWG